MNAVVKRALPWIAYPLVLLLAVSGHLVFRQADFALPLSTYLPVLLAALLVAGLELFIPNQTSWKPEVRDIRNDALFMLLIQVLLPRLLGFLLVISLIDPLHSMGLIITGYWPHDWSPGAQVVLMLVVAEFFRYWLHRFAHTNPLLWRLHAVHHSPEKLYWLNVGRFHPLDKALQFLLDALPFMLLGVSENVIALYFVLYSINGFFQHSNIRLRYGPLNYLISTAELHRWHHSRLSEESNNNYGNNLIIWDLLFGTWFLPGDRDIHELGLKNRQYPQRFTDQMKTPFIGDLTHRSVPLLNARQILNKELLKLAMRAARFLHWWPLRNAALAPRQAQSMVLKGILSRNRGTLFGRDHSFADIQNLDDYRTRVPVQSYESLEPYIRQQIYQDLPAVTQSQPLFYAVTSGTTGTPKYLPVTSETLACYRRAQRMIVFHQYRQCPQAFAGRFLGIVSPATEGHFDNGVAFGSISGHAYRAMPGLVRASYILPPEVFDITDYELKYQLILRLTLAETSLTYIATANPSSLLRLMDVFNASPDTYIKSLAEGNFHRLTDLPECIQSLVLPLLTADRKRSNEITKLIQGKGSLGYGDLWPHLRLVTTWTGGSCGVAIKALKRQLPERAIIYELGYISSEFRGTVPVSMHSPAGLPTLTHHFFEFVEKTAWQDGARDTLRLDQLEDRKEYYIIVTTESGLYRYFMNDIVRVHGFFHRTPLLEFVQKGKGVTSITGEKLYEGQVTRALRRCEDQYGVACTFYLLLADTQNARYQLYLELDTPAELPLQEVANFVDSQLAELNIEYASKRESGRLKPMSAHRLKRGSCDAFKQYHIDQGIREGQYKIVPLLYRDDLAFPIDQYEEDPA